MTDEEPTYGEAAFNAYREKNPWVWPTSFANLSPELQQAWEYAAKAVIDKYVAE